MKGKRVIIMSFVFLSFSPLTSLCVSVSTPLSLARSCSLPVSQFRTHSMRWLSSVSFSPKLFSRFHERPFHSHVLIHYASVPFTVVSIPWVQPILNLPSCARTCARVRPRVCVYVGAVACVRARPYVHARACLSAPMRASACLPSADRICIRCEFSHTSYVKPIRRFFFLSF